MLFVLFLVFATNFDTKEGLVGSFSHINTTVWVSIVMVPLLFGPAFIIFWSYMRIWVRDTLEKN